MEILKALLNLLLEGKSGGVFSLLNSLSENSFDLLKTLKGLNLETAMPIIKDFLSSAPKSDMSNPRADALSPIKKVASDDIVATLNGYFESVNAI